MCQIRTFAAFSALVLLAFPQASSAGAWTEKRGDWHLFNTISYYETDSYQDSHGHKQSQPDYGKLEWEPTIEYGLNDSLTIGASTYLDYLDQTRTNIELADTELFLRQRLWQQDGFVLSAQPLIKLPSLAEHDRAPRGGGDETDLELALLSGYGFQAYGRNHFADVSAAYRHRFESPADQIKLSATLGMQVMDNWMILPQAFMTWSADDKNMLFNQSSAGDYDLLKAQLSIVYQWDDSTQFQLGGFDHVYARNTGNDGGALFSVWKRF